MVKVLMLMKESEEKDQIFEGNEYIIRKYGENLSGLRPDIIFIDHKPEKDEYFYQEVEGIMGVDTQIFIDLGAIKPPESLN